MHNDDVIAFVLFQARASGDYARPEGNMQPWDNVATLGGASLLLGATHMAPSKDTLWTASPQPPTSSDRTTKGYHTQPHVQLLVALPGHASRKEVQVYAALGVRRAVAGEGL